MCVDLRRVNNSCWSNRFFHSFSLLFCFDAGGASWGALVGEMVVDETATGWLCGSRVNVPCGDHCHQCVDDGTKEVTTVNLIKPCNYQNCEDYQTRPSSNNLLSNTSYSLESSYSIRRYLEIDDDLSGRVLSSTLRACRLWPSLIQTWQPDLGSTRLKAVAIRMSLALLRCSRWTIFIGWEETGSYRFAV